jgi:hypothetical protein
MGTNRTIVRRHRWGELTHEQEMELWLGPSHRGPAFGSEDERRVAWIRHRDRLMTAWAKHGRRPHGWWLYESPIPRPRYDTEQSTLYVAGLLTEQERAELIAWWREQYDSAWSPHFSHCEGPGRFFKDAPGRRRHLRWADIPTQLLREWNAARRRRARTIRKLEKEPLAEVL